MEQEIESKHLRMTFDPNTIQHLGIKMYSHLPAAIAELVANAYDADATVVNVRFYENEGGKSIIVSDDGHGMSFDEVNEYFLKIGRNRRSEKLKKTPGGRTASGKKGLGKLALFGIGEKIEVNTRKAGVTEGTNFSLIWEELKNWDRKNGPDYRPSSAVFSKDIVEHGTEIKISDLKRKTPFILEDFSVSLSRLFNSAPKSPGVSPWDGGARRLLHPSC